MGICLVTAEPEPPEARIHVLCFVAGFLRISLAKLIGHPLCQGSWNLTLMTLGPVSMAAGDLLPGPPPSLVDFQLEARRKGTKQL